MYTLIITCILISETLKRGEGIGTTKRCQRLPWVVYYGNFSASYFSVLPCLPRKNISTSKSKEKQMNIRENTLGGITLETGRH